MAVISEDVFEQWLRLKGLKESSIKNYFYYFNRFRYQKFNQESVSRFFSEPGNRNIIAKAFIKNLKECMLRNHQELKIDSAYYIEINDVFIPGVTGRKKKRLIIPLTESQISLLEKTLETEQLKIMLLVCYHAGLRLGELMRLRINSFNWEEWKRNPNEIGEARVIGKGDKERTALIPGWLMKKIANFINQNSGWYSNIDSKIFSIGANSFEKYLYKAGIKSGITKFGENGKVVEETRVHPHKLRHSYGYSLRSKGMDIRDIQDLMGHSSIQSTQIYTQLSTKELKEKLELMHSKEN